MVSPGCDAQLSSGLSVGTHLKQCAESVCGASGPGGSDLLLKTPNTLTLESLTRISSASNDQEFVFRGEFLPVFAQFHRSHVTLCVQLFTKWETTGVHQSALTLNPPNTV